MFKVFGRLGARCAQQKPFWLPNLSQFRYFTTQQDIEQYLIKLLSETDGVDTANLGPTSVLADIGLDSLVQVEMYSQLEQQYDIELNDDDTAGIKSVQDLTNVVKMKLGL